MAKHKPEQGNFSKLENWIAVKDKGIFIVLSVICLLFSLLLFNTRITEGGDDSTYLMAGYNYAHKFTQYYYSFNAPGYPMFLALPISIVGLNIFFLKFLSVIFNFFGFFFLYKALKSQVEGVVLFPVMILLVINSYVQYYASQTYNEAFYMLFQGMFFYFFVKVDEAKDLSLKQTWLKWLLFGFSIFMMSFVKNVAIVSIAAVIAFYLLMREYKVAGIALAAFLAVKLPFELIKKMVWGDIGQYGGQGDVLMLKDPYDRSKGYEEFSGYVDRFFKNGQSFMSKRFYEMLGFFTDQPPNDEKHLPLYTILSMTFVGILIFVLIRSIVQKERIVLLIVLYLGVMLPTSFVALQTRWDQARFMVIYLPLMLIVIFYFLKLLVNKYSIGRGVYISLAVLFILSSFTSSVKKAKKNLPLLSKNIKGDPYAGYTTDWVNFLKMSRWCYDNLPETAYVASRKGPMSFLFANGKEFYPVYRIFGADSTGELNADSVLAQLKREKVTHIMDARLRIDPQKATGNYVNTMTRLLEVIYKKYPDKLVQTHQIPGPQEAQIEPAYLYEIKY